MWHQVTILQLRSFGGPQFSRRESRKADYMVLSRKLIQSAPNGGRLYQGLTAQCSRTSIALFTEHIISLNLEQEIVLVSRFCSHRCLTIEFIRIELATQHPREHKLSVRDENTLAHTKQSGNDWRLRQNTQHLQCYIP
jgi:hypothetical protein